VYPKKITLLVSLFLPFLMGGCPLFEGAPGEEGLDLQDEEEETAEELEEIEAIEETVLQILQETDTVVLLDEPEDAENESNDNDEENNTENNEPAEEFAYDDTILSEVLAKEMEAREEEMPEDSQEAWGSIKMQITELHQQWDELEPTLREENVTEEEIVSFEEALDELTIRASEQDRIGTLDSGNEITEPMSSFLVPFTEDGVSEVYEMKYHLRNLVIRTAAGDYEEDLESQENIEASRQEVTRGIEDEEEAEEKDQQLQTSIDNLEDALQQQEPDLVEIKASLVMEQLVDIEEQLKEEIEEEEEEEEDEEEEDEEKENEEIDVG